MHLKRLSIIFLLLVPLVGFSSQVQYEQPMSQAALDAMDIQHYFRDKEIKTLKAGEDEFITLVKEENTGFPKGIAIIVPEINQSVLRQAAVSNVYDNLNEYGWTSLLLTMPSQLVLEQEESSSTEQADAGQAEGDQATSGAEATPLADDSAQEQGEGASDEPNPNLNIKAFHQDSLYTEAVIEQIEENMAARLNAGWDLAGNYPGFFLVICDGKSCGWLTSLFAKGKLPIPDAMVMLSAHMPEYELNESFAEALSRTEFPVLDLYQSLDNPWVASSIKKRRQLTRKHYKTDYRQRKLHSTFHFHGQERRTIKEIYGFLTAVGM